MADRNEGVYRADEGTLSKEGLIAPSVGLVEHALYFTSAPDVLAKTLQVPDANRLELPGAVVVWDETLGRRKGAKAVPGTWWATHGSVTIALAFPGPIASKADDPLAAVGSAVVNAIDSFAPSRPVTYSGGNIFLDDQLLGEVTYQHHDGAEVFVIRVNTNTDFSAAAPAVRDAHTRLVDYIEISDLPLGRAGTLPNSLSTAIMTAAPTALGFH